jgi:subtilase family serine protease
MAPGAKIVLEEAATNSTTNLYAAVDDAVNNQHAQVVSMSWSGNEYAGETSDDLAHFNKPGVTFLASSGDTGGTVGYPATSPYVLSAGGTSLPFDSNGNPVPGNETTWSSGGGGPSTVETKPGYQAGFYGGTMRGTPDLSSDSDPNTGVLVVYNGGLYIFGGTSVAAPTLAGEIALADQGRATPLSSTSLTSRAEYNAAGGSLYASTYRDITTGTNGYAAAAGYDQATGLGAPLANNLVPWLNASP